MKKFTVITAIILLVAMVSVVLISCKDETPVNTGDYKRPEVTEGFGSTDGLTAANAINKDMSAIQMLEAGVANFYDQGYVATVNGGQIDTQIKVLGIPMGFTQFVQSITVRNGSANGDYQLFNDNVSGSIKEGGGIPIDIRIWEETLYKKTGSTEEIKFHSGTDKDMVAAKDENGNYTMYFQEGKTFKPVETFSNLDDYKNAKAANPTLIWMYDINEDTYLPDGTTAPVFDEATKTYSFTVAAHPENATKEYQKQMMYMLEKQSPVKPDEFRFESIKMTVTMSENGFITKVSIEESYYLKIVGGLVKSTVTLKSDRYFSYQENEKGMEKANFGSWEQRFV